MTDLSSSRLDTRNNLPGRSCLHCGRLRPGAGESMVRVAKGLPLEPRCACDAFAKVRAGAAKLDAELGALRSDLKDATPNQVAQRLTGMSIEEIVRMNHGEFDVD